MAFETVKKNLEARGYTVKVFATGAEAAAYLNGEIDGMTVGFGGSMTLKDMGLYEPLSSHNEIHWHWVDGPAARAQAKDAQVYLTSANGLAENGDIINIDGAGNRVASTLYGHEKVYIVIGRNKLAPTYEEALWRARNIAAPKNAQRLGRKTPCAVNGDRCYDCKSPDRICRGLVVLWGPMMGMETEIVLVDEDLGM
ncbi:MAG: lactate utilization protein [Ruminococcaceae bacterium]|nr:lactate utilization protein [Oscillospiraceae bacterium]